MPPSLTLNKNDEYFLSLAKEGKHSFLMLGVVTEGCPKLLARVGKTNDIDSEVDQGFKMAWKSLNSGMFARLADEGIERRPTHQVNIAYQAYTITYHQMKDFLELIAYIEKKQWANQEIVAALTRVYRTKEKINQQAIEAYVPVRSLDISQPGSQDTDQIIFEYKKLKEYDCFNSLEYPVTPTIKDEILTNINHVHLGNTCRHSAVNIIEAILGFKTKISKQFFIPLNYNTMLIGGAPDKASFYILPPPPNAYDKLTHQQAHTLKLIYKRLEAIPKLYSTNPKTREKFDELKKLYRELAGQSNLHTASLLEKIVAFTSNNEQALFRKRSNRFIGFFSQTSTTEQMFKDIQIDLSETLVQEKYTSYQK